MADLNEETFDYPLPPASFSFLVESLMMQTQMQLGIFPTEDKEEDLEPNLPIAGHSIDLLAMLQEKTSGNLTLDEKRLLENGLTELRFRFVQVMSEQLKRKPEAAAPPVPSETPLIITAEGGKGSKTG